MVSCSDVAEVELQLNVGQSDRRRHAVFFRLDKLEQSRKAPSTPKHPLDEGKKSAERPFPIAQPCCEAQEQISEQGGPYLPLDGVFARSEEIGELERLFDFLEEHLDSPSCEVKVTDGIWRPFELICDEAHLGGFAVAQHP